MKEKLIRVDLMEILVVIHNLVKLLAYNDKGTAKRVPRDFSTIMNNVFLFFFGQLRIVRVCFLGEGRIVN